jgi:hypothetical protein
VKAREPFDALHAEIAGEKAHALSRIAARMERALADLRAFDASDGEPDAVGSVPDGVTREDLVAIAAELVWFYVVQRDVMGWHRHEEALRFYGVPAEVLARMGPRRRG